ncbi:MAG: 50S ribosomal protein L6 [Chloroflexi bacterium]|nr:50S ribosomal protein L6 [Chloroflexota bacterium]MBV9599921.1 50S ribosomal protein L6 [Chloroflexota bacterium]
MSRIGRMPITVPTSVTIDIDQGAVRVKGPRGELSRSVPRQISVTREDALLRVERSSDEPSQRSLHGLTRSLIANMVTGVTDGFSRRLEINGVGYRAAVSAGNLILQVGYSHPVLVPAPQGISFAVQGNAITVSGADKELVGEVASQVRRVRPPEPYKGKGIKYAEEVIRRKAGKAGAKKK